MTLDWPNGLHTRSYVTVTLMLAVWLIGLQEVEGISAAAMNKAVELGSLPIVYSCAIFLWWPDEVDLWMLGYNGWTGSVQPICQFCFTIRQKFLVTSASLFPWQRAIRSVGFTQWKRASTLASGRWSIQIHGAYDAPSELSLQTHYDRYLWFACRSWSFWCKKRRFKRARGGKRVTMQN